MVRRNRRLLSAACGTSLFAHKVDAFALRANSLCLVMPSLRTAAASLCRERDGVALWSYRLPPLKHGDKCRIFRFVSQSGGVKIVNL